MVHDSKRLLAGLKRYIERFVTSNRSAYEVSDAKQDGTVFVRFKSAGDVDAQVLCGLFHAALGRLGACFTRPDSTRFRVPLRQVVELMDASEGVMTG